MTGVSCARICTIFFFTFHLAASSQFEIIAVRTSCFCLVDAMAGMKMNDTKAEIKKGSERLPTLTNDNCYFTTRRRGWIRMLNTGNRMRL